jgi:SIR2-like domain
MDGRPINLPASFKWNQLLDQIEQGRLVPVVGRQLLQLEEGGVMTTLDRWLARRVAAAFRGCAVEEVAPGPGLSEVICAHPPFRANPNEVYAEVHSVYRAHPPPLPAALRDLAAIRPLRCFVAATADNLLEQALNAVRFAGAPRTHSLSNLRKGAPDLDDALLSGDAPVVFQMLGNLDRDIDYALTEEDVLEYVHHLQIPGARPPRMFDQLQQNHLLFLGVAYPDWLARFVLRAARADRLRVPRNLTQYLVSPRLSPEDRLGEFLQEQTASTKYVEADPAAFVAELRRRWEARAPAAGAAPVRAAAPLADPDVFVSYCSDDRPVAERSSAPGRSGTTASGG